jgi:2-C-methyl-D-erythritol 4-phosphate cytidylyltransferase
VTLVATLVLAAGSGSRLGERKQFLELVPGERLVDRAIQTSRAHSGWIGAVVPTNAVSDSFGPEHPAVDRVIAGGADRLSSLRAGLALVPDNAEIVVVHSASHPLASAGLIARLISAVHAGADGVVPILEAVDVIKRVDADGSISTVGREGLGAAQVPMAYAADPLRAALADGAFHIEESMALEAAGGTLRSIAGEVGNIHVTDEASLDLARRLARTQPSVAD